MNQLAAVGSNMARHFLRGSSTTPGLVQSGPTPPPPGWMPKSDFPPGYSAYIKPGYSIVSGPPNSQRLPPLTDAPLSTQSGVIKMNPDGTLNFTPNPEGIITLKEVLDAQTPEARTGLLEKQSTGNMNDITESPGSTVSPDSTVSPGYPGSTVSPGSTGSPGSQQITTGVDENGIKYPNNPNQLKTIDYTKRDNAITINNIESSEYPLWVHISPEHGIKYVTASLVVQNSSALAGHPGTLNELYGIGTCPADKDSNICDKVYVENVEELKQLILLKSDRNGGSRKQKRTTRKYKNRKLTYRRNKKNRTTKNKRRYSRRK
jgi:hypothetical protein